MHLHRPFILLLSPRTQLDLTPSGSPAPDPGARVGGLLRPPGGRATVVVRCGGGEEGREVLHEERPDGHQRGTDHGRVDFDDRPDDDVGVAPCSGQ